MENTTLNCTCTKTIYLFTAILLNPPEPRNRGHEVVRRTILCAQPVNKGSRRGAWWCRQRCDSDEGCREDMFTCQTRPLDCGAAKSIYFQAVFQGRVGCWMSSWQETFGFSDIECESTGWLACVIIASAFQLHFISSSNSPSISIYRSIT